MDTSEVKYALHDERVAAEQVAHSVLLGCFNDNQDVAVICKRSTHNHGAVLEERIHEGGMFCPVGLLPAGFARYPVGTRPDPLPPETGGSLAYSNASILPCR